MDYGWLQIYHRGGLQQDLPLRDEITIGRAEDNDVVLNEATVSPYHAKIVCDSEGCWIVDVTSANGTYVDGNRLPSQQPQRLTEGTTVQIGNTRLIAYPHEVDPSQATQPAPSGPTAPTVAMPMIAPPFNHNSASVMPTAGMSPGNPFPPSGTTAPSPMRAMPAGTAAAGRGSGFSSVNLSLTTGDLAVHAGGSAFTSIYVVNRSNIVNRIELTVDGVPPDWVTIKPSTLSLFPGGQGEAQILINPPRTSSSRAGTHTFEVIARSEEFPSERPMIAGTLTILPYSEFTLDINPQQQTGRIQCTYEVQVANRSNSERVFQFEGREAENAMTFRFQPTTLTLGPGETSSVRTRTRLLAWHLIGRPKIYPFTVNVAPTDQSAPHQQVSGRMVHSPPISPQYLMYLLPLLLMSCSSLYYLYRYNKPKIVQAFREVSRAIATSTPTITPTIFSTDVVVTATEMVVPTPTADTPTLEPTLVPLAPTEVPPIVPVAQDLVQPSPTVPPTNTPTATATATGTATATIIPTTPPTSTPNPTATIPPTNTPTIQVSTAVPPVSTTPASSPQPSASPAPSNTSAPLPTPTTTVSITARVDPESSRDCTKSFNFTGTITLNVPATVKYKWEFSNSTPTEITSIEFASAATKNVYYSLPVTQPGTGWARLVVLEPDYVASGQVTYTLTCDKQRIAYIYNNDISSRDAFNNFFSNQEYFVDLVTQYTVTTNPNAASWVGVVIGNDTSWATGSPETQKVWSLNRPVLGIGNGGRSFFQANALDIGSGGSATSGSAVIPVNRQDSIWAGVPVTNTVQLYLSDTPLVAIYNPQAKLGLIRGGQLTSGTTHYPLVAQEANGVCHKLWGFTGTPAQMTAQGKQVFTNTFNKTSCPPVINKVTLTITEVYCSASLEPVPPQSNGDEVFFTLRGTAANGTSGSSPTTVRTGVIRGTNYKPDMPLLTLTDPAESLLISVEGEEQDNPPESNDGNNSLRPASQTLARTQLFQWFGATNPITLNLNDSNGKLAYVVKVAVTVE